MATYKHDKDDGKIKGDPSNSNRSDDQAEQNPNSDTNNNDKNTSSETQTQQQGSAKKAKVKKPRRDADDIDPRTTEEQWNSVEGLFNKVEKLRNLMNIKDINEKKKNGQYKYSKFLREKYKKTARQTKIIEMAGEVVSGIGKAVSGGYNSGWGMR